MIPNRSTMRKRKKKDENKSNRPQDTKFKQQKLDAWQPILTPGWVIGTFILMGIVFIPIGASLLVTSQSKVEEIIVYDSQQLKADFAKKNQTSPCITETINGGYELIQRTNGNVEPCILTFQLDQDVDQNELVLSYELTNFFQNHRRYVQSRSDEQLRNEVSVTKGQELPEPLTLGCDPKESLFMGNTSLIFYPCGLIATSYFNDGIQLAFFETNGTRTEWTNGVLQGESPIKLDTTSIAWDTDLTQRFRNPTVSTNAGQYGTYAYLWQTYDQMSCYKNENLSQRESNCTTWPQLVRQELGANFEKVVGDVTVAGTGCAACPTNTTAVFEGGIPPPVDNTSDVSAEGIRNENFVVWMRTAALPNFRKIYGRVLRTDGSGFTAGDKIGIRVIPNFLVQPFGGTKALALGTVTELGGRSDVLGIAYLVVGVLCMLLAGIFFLKLKFNPRKLGDPKYLNWKPNAH